jgi:hypothetical protein
MALGPTHQSKLAKLPNKYILTNFNMFGIVLPSTNKTIYQGLIKALKKDPTY